MGLASADKTWTAGGNWAAVAKPARLAGATPGCHWAPRAGGPPIFQRSAWRRCPGTSTRPTLFFWSFRSVRRAGRRSAAGAQGRRFHEVRNLGWGRVAITSRVSIRMRAREACTAEGWDAGARRCRDHLRGRLLPHGWGSSAHRNLWKQWNVGTDEEMRWKYVFLERLASTWNICAVREIGMGLLQNAMLQDRHWRKKKNSDASVSLKLLQFLSSHTCCLSPPSILHFPASTRPPIQRFPCLPANVSARGGSNY
jgi:hypothetical protein